jgi:hypothetical protein
MRKTLSILGAGLLLCVLPAFAKKAPEADNAKPPAERTKVFAFDRIGDPSRVTQARPPDAIRDIGHDIGKAYVWEEVIPQDHEVTVDGKQAWQQTLDLNSGDPLCSYEDNMRCWNLCIMRGPQASGAPWYAVLYYTECDAMANTCKCTWVVPLPVGCNVCSPGGKISN